MSIDKATTMVPVSDLRAAVKHWTRVLGVDPTFIDGERWAQFDVAGARIALAGTDRATDEVGLMLKVADLDSAVESARAAGLEIGPCVEGPHERRVVATSVGSPPLIFYTSR
jgi:hypothetical protein